MSGLHATYEQAGRQAAIAVGIAPVRRVPAGDRGGYRGIVWPGRDPGGRACRTRPDQGCCQQRSRTAPAASGPDAHGAHRFYTFAGHGRPGARTPGSWPARARASGLRWSRPFRSHVRSMFARMSRTTPAGAEWVLVRPLREPRNPGTPYEPSHSAPKDPRHEPLPDSR